MLRKKRINFDVWGLLLTRSDITHYNKSAIRNFSTCNCVEIEQVSHLQYIGVDMDKNGMLNSNLKIAYILAKKSQNEYPFKMFLAAVNSQNSVPNLVYIHVRFSSLIRGSSPLLVRSQHVSP